MRTHIKLGRVFGIQIGLHYSWFLIAALIVFTVGEYFAALYGYWGAGAVWGYAVLTAVLFFITLLLHELSHSLVARARGLPVRAITLFALGGAAQIGGNPATAKTEFLMAIVGPLASAIIGAACYGAAKALGWDYPGQETLPIAAVLGWLGYINFGLAVFNMIPGYPLDGGRVLRAILWWRSGDEDRSGRSAARVGQVVGWLFIAWGVFRFLAGAGFGGLWLAFIGWFLVQVAGESYREVGLRHVLEGLRVGDLMARDCISVDGHYNLQTFVQEFVLRTGQRCFVVEQNGHVEGLVTPTEVSQVQREKWPYTTVDQVMQPIDEGKSVDPETPVIQALEVMARDNISQLPVVSQGRLSGIFSRLQVMQYFQTHAELRA